MSPLPVRRFRAERLLRQEFERLRARVLAAVRTRLAAGGRRLDMADLEACYGQAWQGLYAAVLEGQEIANPAGWLVIVTARRAIEELRLRHHSARSLDTDGEHVACEPDVAGRIDDLWKLRQLFEAMSARLDGREREAATLCYLQGLTRAEAASRMGVSERRMRKLMEGDGGRRRGVAGRVGELVATIGADGWCEEQASTMRALAFGILDERGERYRVAHHHQRECPACRRYVLSLRGLAAVFPPVVLPGLMPHVVGLGVGVGAGAGSGAGAGVGSGAGAGAGSGAGAGAGSGAALGAGGGLGPAVLGALGAKVAAGLAAVGAVAGSAVLVSGSAARSRDGAATPYGARATPAQAARPLVGVSGVSGDPVRASSSPHAAGEPAVGAKRAHGDEAQRPRAAAQSSSRRPASARSSHDGSLGGASEFGIEGPAEASPAAAPTSAGARAAAAGSAARAEPSGSERAEPSAPQASSTPSVGSSGGPAGRASPRPGGEFSFE